jgi:hypothetical protein
MLTHHQKPGTPTELRNAGFTTNMDIIVAQPTDFPTKRPEPIPGETLRQRLDRFTAYRKALHRHTKAQRRKPQRRRPTTEAIRWLKDKVFCHVYGEKIGDAVYPSMRKEAFVGFYNEHGHGKKLPNYKLQDHFDRLKTYYYWSSPNKTAEYALAMIDVDVQKSKMLGSPEGARKFAAFLRTWFPNLYVEASTGGKGQHAYLLVRKPGHSVEEVKAALKHLERWLRQQAQGFDVEIVEVKGTPPVVKYRDGGSIESITYGSFAKLPRDASRFSEWANTTTMTVQELLALPLVEEKPAAEEKVQEREAKQQQCGSVSGKNISQDELDLMPTWERFFKEARKNKPLHGDRWAVTETDFAQAAVLLRFFTENRNPDGSLPQRRVQELWAALHEAGDFTRPWNHHRWKAIRDWMSEMGWLHWQDHRYQNGTGRGDGQACKWRLHQDFVLQLDWLALHHEEGRGSFMDTGVIQKGHGEPLKPLRYWFKQAAEAILWLEAEEAMENLRAA